LEARTLRRIRASLDYVKKTVLDQRVYVLLILAWVSLLIPWGEANHLFWFFNDYHALKAFIWVPELGINAKDMMLLLWTIMLLSGFLFSFAIYYAYNREKTWSKTPVSQTEK